MDTSELSVLINQARFSGIGNSCELNLVHKRDADTSFGENAFGSSINTLIQSLFSVTYSHPALSS